MFHYSQLLDRETHIGQTWMTATSDERINSKQLNELNIPELCEEISKTSVHAAPRLSAILLNGAIKIYQQRVNQRYDYVNRLMGIDEAMEIADPSYPAEETSMAENQQTHAGEIDQRSPNFSNAATTTMESQRAANFDQGIDEALKMSNPTLPTEGTSQDGNQQTGAGELTTNLLISPMLPVKVLMTDDTILASKSKDQSLPLQSH